MRITVIVEPGRVYLDAAGPVLDRLVHEDIGRELGELVRGWVADALRTRGRREHVHVTTCAVRPVVTPDADPAATSHSQPIEATGVQVVDETHHHTTVELADAARVVDLTAHDPPPELDYDPDTVKALLAGYEPQPVADADLREAALRILDTGSRPAKVAAFLGVDVARVRDWQRWARDADR